MKGPSRAFASLAVLLLMAWPRAARAATEAGGPERWVVVAARSDQTEAIDLARTYARSVNGVHVARAKNGWYAIVVGPLLAKSIGEARSKLALRLDIPSDAYLGRIDGFQEHIFDAPPSPILAVGDYRDGPPTVLRYGALEVVLSSSPGANGSRTPMATIRTLGSMPFRTAIADMSLDATAFAKARIVRVDSASPGQQVVTSFYTGGAHCCTITHILTQNDTGLWIAIDTGSLDGDGYEFEDVVGDGAAELITVDSSFFYAFASYADSYAPPQVFRVAGGALHNITKDPSVRPFIERELRAIEAAGAKDASLWSNNGFLAGWVATEALLGDVEAAWSRMLTSYDRNPPFPLEECVIIALSMDRCPSDKIRQVSFPQALRKHFLLRDYPVPSATAFVVAPPAAAAGRPLKSAREPDEVLSGSAFFITSQGHLLTNAHVVQDCRVITVSHGADDPLPGKLVASDPTNDLAIVGTTSKPEAVATFRLGVRLGEEVAVFGYPLSGLLASGGNFTLGNVTALAGLRDDSRMLQISAPIQPGNSGGPLLDEAGAVVGIVVSKLNAVKLAIATDDLAQNVNFAIKASTAESFIAAQGIPAQVSTPGASPLRPDDLADKAKSITARLECMR
jgi:S1-C subfamily serine protease